MAAARKREGFDPARGRPAPEDLAAVQGAKGAPPPSDIITHFPARNGPVCDVQPIPTHASQYSMDDPTCPTCANYLAKTRAHTLRTQQQIARAAEARAGTPGTNPSEGEP